MSRPSGCMPMFFMGLIIVLFIAMALCINAGMWIDPNTRFF